MVLIDFAADSNATATWKVTNDPVMGGQSTSSWAVVDSSSGGKQGKFAGDNKVKVARRLRLPCVLSCACVLLLR